jgi:butyryl-CoA dehydrogenase
VANPLIPDRDVEFLLWEVHDLPGVLELGVFAEYGREEIDLYLAAVTRFARERLYPLYRTMDEEPPRFDGERVKVHPSLRELWNEAVRLGLLSAERPESVGGAGLPQTVATMAQMMAMAGNAAAIGYVFLTTGAAHLIESFGTDEQRATLMTPMYEGRWAGTMALTEPHAGSSLADVTTKAIPAGDGSYRIKGSKIFISGGDQDITENVVHMTLARIEGAAEGTRGISLFAVPSRRPASPDGSGALVSNDVHTTQMIHKVGWKGLPSLALSYGENDDCHGWLIGEPGRGLKQMFQMMNGARLAVGANGVATASVAYQESLTYARERKQGRALGQRGGAPVSIVEHAPVRRLLLRQKAIVEGGMSLIVAVARLSDIAEYGGDADARARAQSMLDLLTPVAKSFPAERGYESNVLAVQILGGYGYSSEYLPESWLRDQKLNSIHEGTTQIQAMDLLGRKVVAGGGSGLRTLIAEIEATAGRATEAGVDAGWGEAVVKAAHAIGALTMELGAKAMGGDVPGMMMHSDDYLTAFSTICIAWQWLGVAAAAHTAMEAGRDVDAQRGRLCAAEYWIATEIPDALRLIALCRSGEDSYGRMQDAWF